MGEIVLNITSSPRDPLVRLFAHCLRGIEGGIGIAFLNIHNQSTVINFEGFDSLPREEYHLTSESLTSQSMELNGKTLKLSNNGDVPPLNPHVEEKVLEAKLNPLSYGFFAFPEANFHLCM